jgi:hypothetical protein
MIDKTICYHCKVKLNEYEKKKNLYYDGTNIIYLCYKCYRLNEHKNYELHMKAKQIIKEDFD